MPPAEYRAWYTWHLEKLKEEAEEPYWAKLRAEAEGEEMGERLQSSLRTLLKWSQEEKAPERARLLGVLHAYATKPRPTAWERLLKDDP